MGCLEVSKTFLRVMHSFTFLETIVLMRKIIARIFTRSMLFLIMFAINSPMMHSVITIRMGLIITQLMVLLSILWIAVIPITPQFTSFRLPAITILRQMTILKLFKSSQPLLPSIIQQVKLFFAFAKYDC